MVKVITAGLVGVRCYRDDHATGVGGHLAAIHRLRTEAASQVAGGPAREAARPSRQPLDSAQIDSGLDRTRTARDGSRRLRSRTGWAHPGADGTASPPRHGHSRACPAMAEAGSCGRGEGTPLTPTTGGFRPGP